MFEVGGQSNTNTRIDNFIRSPIVRYNFTMNDEDFEEFTHGFVLPQLTRASEVMSTILLGLINPCAFLRIELILSIIIIIISTYTQTYIIHRKCNTKLIKRDPIQ